MNAQESLREYEVQTIRFVGNETFGEEVLQSVTQLRETPSWFFKFLFTVSEKLGERNEYFDPIVFETDFARLRNFYHDHGFFHVHIDTQLSINHTEKTVALTYVIQEGRRSYIDSVVYNGLEGLPGEVIEEVRNQSLLQVGEPFQTQVVDNELRRIVQVFVNHGYIAFRVDTLIAKRFASTNNVKIEMRFTAGGRYRFGAIRILSDTAVTERVEEEVILRHLDFRTGDFYSEAKKAESERNLNRLGVFESAQVQHVFDPSNDTSRAIPIQINVRPRPFHEITPEVGVSDENNAFNILFGVGYNNRYFLGGARNFSTRAGLQIQSIQSIRWSEVFKKGGHLDSSLVGKFDLSVQMIQPYLFTNKISLSWTISSIFEKQKAYFLPILNNRVGIAAQTADFTRLFVDWNLQRINPTVLIGSGPDPLQGRGLQPQFNSIITFTLQRDKRNDLFSPTDGFFHSGSVEEAGFLPSLFGGVFGSRLPYSRYYKLSIVGQWYWNVVDERYLILATRVKGGYAQLYARSPANEVPLTRRFFGGGSSSVRGWKSRELGAFPQPDRGGNASFEANVETRWHLFKYAGKLWFINLPNISLVFFYDAGNVWRSVGTVRGSEVAMATGLGFRWDTIAGPVRIDFGVRVYDPTASVGQRWITERRFFAETASSGVLHFGIGHSF